MSGERPRWAWFDEVAEEYAAVRPTYPASLFDLLGDLRGLQVLEIGPGTGQATAELVRRGAQVTAYEAGATLARMTAEHVPEAHVVHARAEEATGPYDVVCGFTALHWLEDELWPLAHRLLSPGGRLAYATTVMLATEGLEDAMWPVHVEHLGAERGRWDDLPDVRPPTYDAELFDLTAFAWAPVTTRMTSAEYAALTRTWSPAGTLEPAARAAFLDDVRTAVDGLGGSTDVRTAFSVALFTPRRT